MANVNQLRYFVPFDVDEAIVRRVSEELVREYPGLHIHGVVGDFLVIWSIFRKVANVSWSSFEEPLATFLLSPLTSFSPP